MTRLRWDRTRTFKSGTVSITSDEERQAFEWSRKAGSTGSTGTPRELGINPRALGTNPRAIGANPRSTGETSRELRQVKWIPSPDEVDAARSPRGGWTRATLAKWGVPWPPPKGWRRELEKRWRNKMRAYAKAHAKPL